MNQEKIDIVVTDISMPLMDGIELIKAVKRTAGSFCDCA